MQYRPRVPREEIEWIKKRIAARGEECQEWASYLHMSKSQFSHIFDQSRPLPEKYETDWQCMKRILKEESDYEKYIKEGKQNGL